MIIDPTSKMGYIDYSMSVNAGNAYERGLLPASKIKGVPVTLIEKFVGADEWHHTSSRYNETNFYNPIVVRIVFGLGPENDDVKHNPAAIAALTDWKAAQKSKPEVYLNCHVEFLDWFKGSYGRTTCAKCSEEGCRVEVKGQTATITLPNGSVLKKRLTTNGFIFKVRI